MAEGRGGVGAARVRKTRTAVGLVTVLEVSGAWQDEWVQLARDRGCDGVQWYMDGDSGRTCDPLLALADALVFVRVRASRTAVDDGALAGMPGLRFVDATTRARNELDLTGTSRLSVLMVDDREGLDFTRGDALRTAELYCNKRDLDFFEGAERLKSLQLESRPATVVDFTARLPGLERLRLAKGSVSTFQGLVAPRLQVLSLDRVGGGELDLADLAGSPGLRQVSITPREPLVVRSAGSLSCNLITNDAVTIA